MVELYLAQWRWDASDSGKPHWAPPTPGALGALDLRPLPAQALAGGAPQGWGLFVYPTPVAISNALHLGAIGAPLAAPTKDELRSRLDIPVPLEGNTLLDCLWNILSLHADPTGQNRSKPLMPTAAGRLELHLGGFSLIKSKALTKADPEWPVVLEALREQYRHIRAAAQPRQVGVGGISAGDTHLRVLGHWARQYGLDYRLFIPAGLPDEGMLEPHTTITDNFNRADADALGASSEGWSWTEVVGDTDISANKAVGGAAGQNAARANSDLSTENHYSQGDSIDGAGGAEVGTSTRFAAAASTYYMGVHRNHALGTYQIFKSVTGAITQLAFVDATAPGAGAILNKLSSNGSTQEFTSGGVVRITLTDTAITGNLRTGMFISGSTGSIDNFQAGDLATPTQHSQAVIIS